MTKTSVPMHRGATFEFYGRNYTVRQLSRIFKQKYGTVRGRIQQGWPLEAALAANTTGNWSITTIDQFLKQEWVSSFIKDTLNGAPKVEKTEKVEIRELVEDTFVPIHVEPQKSVNTTVSVIAALMDSIYNKQFVGYAVQINNKTISLHTTEADARSVSALIPHSLVVNLIAVHG